MEKMMIAGIVTAIIYGIILSGCITPILFIARTKQNVIKFGYKKYTLILAGVEVILVFAAGVVLFLCANSFYHSIIWSRRGVDMSFFITVYQIMLRFVVPLYVLMIAAAGIYVKRRDVKKGKQNI